MNYRTMLFSGVCVVALLYLAIANARGYVPFATPTTKTLDRTTAQFHK